MAEHIEQAQTLLAVREGLGEFYDEQKTMFLDTILALPSKEAATALNSFVGIGFITKEELNQLVKRLFSKNLPQAQPQPAAPVAPQQPPPSSSPHPPSSSSHSPSFSQIPLPSQPQPSSGAQNEDLWGGKEPLIGTRVSEIKPQLSRLAAVSDQDINALVDSLTTLNVFSIAEVMQTDSNNEKFHFLDDLMSPHVFEVFKKSVSALQKLPCVAGEMDKGASTMQEVQRLRSTQQVVDSNYVYHLWNDTSQLLVLPVLNKAHFFCSVETQATEATLTKGGHLIFCLDVSASMNHDAKRSYCTPKSPDHPDSSIKKARELIPKLALPAIKRLDYVTVIIWNYKIQNVIEFSPGAFLDPETGTFTHSDEQIVNRIVIDTNESVFRARGGTNIEAALKELGTKMKSVANKVAQFSIWFLTDGEETIYLQPDGACEHIPTNSQQTLFRYFNEETEDGTTQYQRKMVNDLVAIKDELAASQSYIQFHACHFGEAHPLFLKSLASAVNGHFHTFTDVAAIAQEINANIVSTGSNIGIVGYAGAKEERFRAALSEGFLISRGELSADTFGAICSFQQPKIKTLISGEQVLNNRSTIEFTAQIKECVSQVISLEAELAAILQDTAECVKAVKLRQSAQQLRDLRQRRADAINNIPRSVLSNPMLLAFLEKILESVESQMESFTRLLGQYLQPEQSRYDSAMVNKSDMFTTREQLAISAGVESMRVQTGTGFVAKATLDKYVQRMVAEHGCRALKMLERVCLVAETIKDDITLLSLLIIEGRELKERRARYAANALTARNHPAEYTTKYSDTLRHKNEGEVVADVKIMVYDNASPPKLVEEIKEEVPVSTVYPNFVATYHCAPKTDDLDDACKRLLDPLSYSHFLDLIRENNTLPSILYTISMNQSPGVFFNAKEMLYVKGGGSDSTSLDYFRLFWRLAKKDESSCVKVPGAFAPANFALPIAPEPFTNMVLSCLMPGLLSEFITGTAMAPLTGIVDLYIGFLLMHMRGGFSGLDITRISELLSTMRVWVDNPHTMPKPEAFREIIDQMVKDQAVAPAVSSGKLMPLKAFAYALLDDQQPFHLKYSALYGETFKRYIKQLIVPNGELGKNPKIKPELARNQTGQTDFFRDIVTALVGPAAANDTGRTPVLFLSTAQDLAKVITENNPDRVLDFLLIPQNTHTLAGAVWKVLNEKGNAGLYPEQRWSATQRLFSAWACIGSYPCGQIRDAFAKFLAPLAFENHMSKLIKLLVKDRDAVFASTLVQWMEEPRGADTAPVLMTLEYTNNKLQVRAGSEQPRDLFGCDPEFVRAILMKFWTSFMHPILNQWYWKSRPGTAFGLLEIDYDIVRAISEPQFISSLSQVQVAELNAALGYKEPKYFRFLPEQPQAVSLPQSANFESKQEAKLISERPRVSCIFIGANGCGKSTICGHLVVKAGFVDQRTLQKCVTGASEIGRASAKYAWLLDRLRLEREKGLSIETTTWGMDTERYEVDLIDAPGSHDFVKNMMVGASLADVAFLVVDASPARFEAGIARGGMTREEALISYALGIRQFIVLVTHMDTVGYDNKSRFEEVSENVQRFFKQLGLNKPVPVIPISGYQEMPWFTGSPGTIIEAINSLEPPQRIYDAPARVSIMRSFKISGAGTVAVGRVVSGVLKRNDAVTLAPSGIQTEVASIEIYHTGRNVALPGDLIGLRLKNVSVAEVTRGLVACSVPPNMPPPGVVVSFVAQVIILHHPNAIHPGFTPFVCIHTRTVACRFVKFLEKQDRRTGAVLEMEPKSLKTGEVGLIVIEPVRPTYVEPVSRNPALARFVVRDGSSTVAVGVVKSVTEEDKKKPKAPKAPATKNKILRGRK